MGRVVFAFLSALILLLAGGGFGFLSRPVGVAYLALWISYWLVQATRLRGVPSEYDTKQRRVYLSGVVIIPVLILVPTWEYISFSGPIPRDGLVAFAGLLLFAVGILLMAAAMRSLGRLYTSYLGIQADHRLVTNGPYRFVRHPGYLGEMLSMFGIGLSMSSLVGLALAVASMPLVLYRIPPEEEMLMARFGDEYREYTKRSRHLIPLVY